MELCTQTFSNYLGTILAIHDNDRASYDQNLCEYHKNLKQCMRDVGNGIKFLESVNYCTNINEDLVLLGSDLKWKILLNSKTCVGTEGFEKSLIQDFGELIYRCNHPFSKNSVVQFRHKRIYSYEKCVDPSPDYLCIDLFTGWRQVVFSMSNPDETMRPDIDTIMEYLSLDNTEVSPALE